VDQACAVPHLRQVSFRGAAKDLLSGGRVGVARVRVHVLGSVRHEHALGPRVGGVHEVRLLSRQPVHALAQPPQEVVEASEEKAMEGKATEERGCTGEA